MADVFVSYATEDRSRAEQVAGVLTRAGWTVWWDGELLPGDRYRDAIHRELNAAKCVVVLWSTASVESNFVLDEAGEAMSRGVLVQVLIEDVNPPLGFRQIQRATLVGWDGWNEHPGLAHLREGIARHVRPGPKLLVDQHHPDPEGIQGRSWDTPCEAPPRRRRLMLVVVLTVLAIVVALMVGFW
jgi:hypothetical protein